ncbi:VOC family protein [Siccirubricoccus sp. KC 17139]|uniref:VOC family protein n=1 Tax=Siccirubricoccus soli TaxID=2899147 RepID=A0ABT1D8N2_9PROT|nr:VOC family protein [Siccirubricoccus soli]MCO6418295.1 VOC family protein [Siccirubricoccus soli]MCP2684430.1 VOC family protein [Siccirubricoccus soli]
MGVLQIDHVVVDVRDRMAEGAETFRRLGFQLTPMGKHSLGSANHLAVFGTDYLELLGTDVPGGKLRPDIAPFPQGLNGLVFRAWDGESEALEARLRANGVPAQPAQSFNRPVELPDGTQGDAKFKVVRLDRAAAFDGRLYWCEHMTPEHVWRPEWQEHPNGTLGIARVLLSVRDPERQAAQFRRMFGAEAVTMREDGRAVLRVKDAAVEAAPHAAVAAELGNAAPNPAGRGDYMALLGLKVKDVAEAARCLMMARVQAAMAAGILRVPAKVAVNTTIDFVA